MPWVGTNQPIILCYKNVAIPPPPKVKPVSAKNGYKKTDRRSHGRTSKLERYYEKKLLDREAETGKAALQPEALDIKVIR